MWRLTENVAQLQTDFLSARVDASHPDQGICAELVGKESQQNQWAGSLLRILFLRAPQTPSLRLTEVYERFDDLVASYEELADPQVRPQVYWRYFRSEAVESAFGIEIIVSVQTSTLDCRPTVLVESHIATDHVNVFQNDAESGLRRGVRATSQTMSPKACLFLARISNTPLSYVEMADPADFYGSQIVSSSNEESGQAELTIQHQLQTDRLEKGVIRRCRVRSLFIPADNDEATALRCYEEFLESPLPLTT